MLTKNVIYGSEPAAVNVLRIAKTSRAVVALPVNVRSEGSGNEIVWIADEYRIEREWAPDLAERVTANYDEWLATAKAESVPETTLADVVQAVNDLADLVLGGE